VQSARSPDEGSRGLTIASLSALPRWCRLESPLPILNTIADAVEARAWDPTPGAWS